MKLTSQVQQDTRANGKEKLDTVKETKFGQMAPATKDHGKTVKHTDTEGSCMFSETSMKECGSETKLTGRVSLHMLMVPHMMENGKMIFSMDKELSTGMIARNTKDHTIKEISMGLEAILGLMDLITQGIGLKIRYKETVSTPGKTAESTTEIG